jgi:hypothetical protein
VADVSSVEFSNPELVDVSKAEADMTVGEIKADRGLEVQYSADLTEEQIAEINAQTVKSGDWALISLKPFLSDETLTVTMKNGDVFAVRITDAQISTHVLTADGKDFVITVTYGPGAEIPAGAKLEADEIEPGSPEFLDYLAKTKESIIKSAKEQDDESDESERSDAEAVNQPETAGDDVLARGSVVTSEQEMPAANIGFARFFDIRIMAGGIKIEPAEPVRVTISYEDALEAEDDEDVLAVHFGEQGIELIETNADQGDNKVVFMQSSFSVTGTVVTSNGNWPGSNGNYVIYVRSGSQYYAVAHDGSLHEVTVSGNQVTFPDDAETFDLNNYLWTYERQSGLVPGWGIVDNYFVYYLDADGHDHYISPSSADGIAEASTALSRNNSGYIYTNNNYIGVQNGSIVGNVNQSSAVPVQFANNFILPRRATIHFVDRYGKPLNGVTYKGPSILETLYLKKVLHIL